MRRVLLFAAFLLLLGLTTATAASFSVQAEDITSFSTSTTIEVPTGSPLTGTLYIRSDNLSIPGQITVTEPLPDNGVNRRTIEAGTGTVAAQNSASRYHSWILVAPEGGYTLNGSVKLTMFQDGSNVPVMTAALFRCGTAVPDGAEAQCDQIAEGNGSAGIAAGNQFEPRTVDFGAVVDAQFPFGTELRLKIVNRSGVSWDLRWGWNSSFPARLEVS